MTWAAPDGAPPIVQIGGTSNSDRRGAQLFRHASIKDDLCEAKDRDLFVEPRTPEPDRPERRSRFLRSSPRENFSVEHQCGCGRWRDIARNRKGLVQTPADRAREMELVDSAIFVREWVGTSSVLNVARSSDTPPGQDRCRWSPPSCGLQSKSAHPKVRASLRWSERSPPSRHARPTDSIWICLCTRDLHDHLRFVPPG